MIFKDNYDRVLKNIEDAKNKSTYKQEVSLLAVTKTHGTDVINEAIDSGITDIAENRVQEIQKKYSEINKDVNWHLIGSLQTNKVKYIIDKVSLIHSLDRIQLAKEINKRAKSINKIQDCLIQIKISEEESKRGLSEENLLDFIKECKSEYPYIRVRGLMGMAPFFEDPEETRSYFSDLRALFDRLREEMLLGDEFDILSMGMSNDYTVAIEEGATMVRIGSALFAE